LLYDDSTQTVLPVTTGRFAKPGIGELYGTWVTTFPVTESIRSRKPWEMAQSELVPAASEAYSRSRPSCRSARCCLEVAR
jgi:hypothetical protein